VAFSFGGIVGFKWFVFLSMNITTLPLLIVSIVGWIMALNRSDLGKRAALATSGLAVLIAAVIHRDAATPAREAPADASSDRLPS